MSYVGLVVSFVFVNNLVFTYFLGLGLVMDTTRSVRSGLALGIALTLFLTLAGVLAQLANGLVLVPLGFEFLRTVLFVLLVVGLVSFSDYVLRSLAPSLRKLLHPNGNVMTAHCATLGMMLIVVRSDYTVLESVVAGSAAGIGIILAVGLTAAVRQQLEREWVPAALRGAPIAFISAGLIAMALFAFDRALLINLVG